MNRRTFMKLVTAGAAGFISAPGVLGTQVRGSEILWGRLKFHCAGTNPDSWGVHPHGDLNFIDAINSTSSTNILKHWNVADISDLDQMCRYPFLFMHTESPPVLDDAGRANLREFLLRGGFLFAEDCVIGTGSQGRNELNDKFFIPMTEEFPRILPEARFGRIPLDHPVFEAFYQIRRWPHMQGMQHGPHGLMIGDRLVALLSPSDLHCGWTNGDNWFGPGQAKAAFEMGTNIYIYAMTQR